MFKRTSIAWFTVSGLLVFTQALVAFFLPSSYRVHVFSDVLQTLLLLACYLTTLPNQVARRSSVPAFWTLLSIGFALWLLNQVLWTFYEAVLHTAPQSGFWGDVVLFLHPVPMMMALAIRPHLDESESPTLLNVSNSAMVVVWWAYLYLYFVMPWRQVVFQPSTWDQNYNLVYGAANIGLAVLAGLSLWKSRGKWRTLYAHLFGAASLYAVGSFMASAAIDGSQYYSGSVYDIPLVIAFAWYAGLGLVALDLKLDQQDPQARPKVSNAWGTRLAAAALLSVAAIEVRAMFLKDIPPEVATYRTILSAATIVLLLALFLFRRSYLHQPNVQRFAVAARRSASTSA